MEKFHCLARSSSSFVPAYYHLLTCLSPLHKYQWHQSVQNTVSQITFVSLFAFFPLLLFPCIKLFRVIFWLWVGFVLPPLTRSFTVHQLCLFGLLQLLCLWCLESCSLCPLFHPAPHTPQPLPSEWTSEAKASWSFALTGQEAEWTGGRMVAVIES